MPTRTIRDNMQAALAAHSITTLDTYHTQPFFIKHAHAYAFGIIAEKARAGLRANRECCEDCYNEANATAFDACQDIADFAPAFDFIRNPGNALLLDEILEGYANG